MTIVSRREAVKVLVRLSQRLLGELELPAHLMELMARLGEVDPETLDAVDEWCGLWRRVRKVEAKLDELKLAVAKCTKLTSLMALDAMADFSLPPGNPYGDADFYEDDDSESDAASIHMMGDDFEEAAAPPAAGAVIADLIDLD